MAEYAYIVTYVTDLYVTLQSLNRYKHKIVSVTQNGNVYTIFYEIRGNAKDGKN